MADQLTRSEGAVRRYRTEELLRLGRDSGWSLSTDELAAIRAHFDGLRRSPTDVEMETLAQTWSEHCKHKTLTSPIVYREGTRSIRFENLLRETVFEATKRLKKPWCLSVFKDNAGLVAFDPSWALAFKVETHNHPCAVEPYGGSETGVGGVIRDVLGAGLGAKPILNTDTFCVGSTTDPGGPGRLAPARTLREMVAGVRDYGNRMGIPTASGGLYFDAGYRANPLVFCGTLGLMPRSAVSKTVREGDLIVAAGGRTGMDGLHGATLSSASLETFESSAVQIGHAILEKKLLDALLKARDLGLYRAVTDCGAGGFSSAVGEMAEGLGAVVDLEKAPLKYEGLAPWQVWLSESQERMVLAVPPEKLERLEAVFEAEGVETAVLGRFKGSGKLEVRWRGETAADVDLDFLHDGLPRRTRRAVYKPAGNSRRSIRAMEPGETLRKLLAHPNICSRSWIVRQYDHEVQGQTALKPLQGNDGPGDACVVWPRTQVEGFRGVAAAQGLAPELGKLDPRLMAFAAVDEAIRNLAAVGAEVEKASILDNFCWGDTDDPKELGRLVRCAVGAKDASLAYGAPFISGKDSLHNTATVGGKKLDIPGTLLVSAIAPVPDVRRCVSMDFKSEGSSVYLVGRTYNELGGSHYALLAGGGGDAPQIRPGAAKLAARLAAAMRGGLALSCHDLSEGGLAVAAAEMAVAGGIGAELELGSISGYGKGLDALSALFAESWTRWLVEVAPKDEKRFMAAMKGLPVCRLGATGGELLEIASNGVVIVEAAVAGLAEIFHGALPELLGEAE
jgi:phosphoribosylformylglycinamidine synthase